MARNAWEVKFNVRTYRFTELPSEVRDRAVRLFNLANCLPESYEPDYSEIMAEAVRFTKTWLVWSC